ncbi:hypothetical protein LJB76_02600 [Clostridia bacterium OttesenSCG-928-O13]|nr:hypothetical protein [Clostridia bacterium OttesenSCG-928-O13]
MNDHKEFDSYWEDGVQHTVLHYITAAEHRHLTRTEALFDAQVEAARSEAEYWRQKYEEIVSQLSENGVQPAESKQEDDEE